MSMELELQAGDNSREEVLEGQKEHRFKLGNHRHANVTIEV